MIITGTKKPCSPPRSQGSNTTNHHKGSISMTSLALSFNDVNFTPVQQDNQIWLTASELAKALGYSKSNAVTQVYDRNQDEFNSSMTTVINLNSSGSFENLNLRLPKKEQNLVKTVRIFTLRGCHLIAMFSKTDIAKQFRKWVLDILDSEVLNQQVNSKQTISPEQAGILYNIVHTRANGNGGTIASMWSRLKHHFKYSASYRELRAIHFEDAKHYLEMLDIKVKAEKQEVKTNKIEVDKHFHDNAYGLALHMIWVNRWWKEFGDAIRVISPRMAGAINDHFADGVCFAYHFVDKQTVMNINERVESYSWHLSCTERMALDYRRK